MAEKELTEAREFVRKMKIVLTNRPEEGEEDAAASAAAKNPNENNQKFGLLAALLKAGAWGLADTILTRLPRAYCLAQVQLRARAL